MITKDNKCDCQWKSIRNFYTKRNLFSEMRNMVLSQAKLKKKQSHAFWQIKNLKWSILTYLIQMLKSAKKHEHKILRLIITTFLTNKKSILLQMAQICAANFF